MALDPVKRAFALRKTLKKGDEILVVDFSDTLQGKDTSRIVDLMPNVATNHYILRAKANIKELDRVTALKYHKDHRDTLAMTPAEIETLVKTAEFDFPLWFKHARGYDVKRIRDYNLPLIVQVAGCNFHDGTGGCRYCFVDDKSNDGVPRKGKTYLSPADHIDSVIAARSNLREKWKSEGIDFDPKVVRMSGGEPTIVMDYMLSLWREIGRRGLDFVGQLDSNLSTAAVVREFEEKGVYKPHTLENLAQYPVKVLAAIKGVTSSNIAANVRARASLDMQQQSLIGFIEAGFDVYPQLYNPDPAHLKSYLTMMEKCIENFSLRVHIGPLHIYGPTRERLTQEALRCSYLPEDFITRQQQAWDKNYHDGIFILNEFLQTRYHVGYKETIRSDVRLRVLKREL